MIFSEWFDTIYPLFVAEEADKIEKDFPQAKVAVYRVGRVIRVDILPHGDIYNTFEVNDEMREAENSVSPT